MLKKLLFVLLLLGVLFGGYLGLAFVLRALDSSKQTIPNFVKKAANNVNVITDTEPDLIGVWDTGCLIPDKSSPWAERHTITLNSNGTAIHKRQSGDTCATIVSDLTDDFNWVVPATGKIDLSYTSGGSSWSTNADVNPNGCTFYLDDIRYE